MLIDVTLPVTPEMREAANAIELSSRTGHLGTHFDVMNKTFPLEYLKLDAVVFDVSGAGDREIQPDDFAIDEVGEKMFAAFYSGAIDKLGYGSREYFLEHPQLSVAVLDALLDRKAAIIGIDFAGVRRGSEHSPMDQKCADRGAFVIENLCGLDKILRGGASARFLANTYPVNFLGMSGLPCRVVAEM